VVLIFSVVLVFGFWFSFDFDFFFYICSRDEDLLIPPDFNFDSIAALSIEEKEKLQKYRPTSIGAASRIPGLTPSSLILMLKYVKRRKRQPTSSYSTPIVETSSP
jgi:hypothetical protein